MAHEERSTFGRLLRSHRADQGLSLAQLATRLHFDKGYVSKVETDKRQPSLSFAKACDRVLDSGDTFTVIAEALGAAGRAEPRVRPAQLLAAHRNFVGRHRQFDRLDAALLADGRSLGLPVAIIEGPPGIGKTEFAVQWARRAVDRGRFADGQLFVDLRGPHPSAPAEPGAVLANLLEGLGVPTTRMPADPDQRGALFRSLLHDRDLLLVLDNGAEARQIYPLLPGSGGCAVVITSRVRLTGLTSRVGAVTLTLPELAAPEAIRLLRSIIGERRAAADPAAVTTLAELCGYLPLALVLAAEQIVHHSHRSAATLAARLVPEHARLDLAEGLVSIRDAFDSAYVLLDTESARVFRLLGLHGEVALTAAVTAAVAGVTEDHAAHVLDELAGVHLVRRRDQNVFQLNDLVRAYAAELEKLDEVASWPGGS